MRASVLKLWRAATRGADETDLADLTRFNESIDQSLAEAVRSYTKRVDQSRELFLATLGHDLRAPLNAMTLSAQVLARSGQLDDDLTAVASRVGVYGQVMTRMIHDLLDFTQTRLGGGIPLSVGPLDLGVLVEDVLNEVRTAHPNRTLHFESPGDLAGQWDGARLRQVLSNLIGNAIEHGAESGAIEVMARGEDSQVVLSVTNRGPAIEPSALPTIFDPFVRASIDRGRRAGIGLGLYIAREIVIAHGGTIAVDSSERTGTVFTVRLPRRRQKET